MIKQIKCYLATVAEIDFIEVHDFIAVPHLDMGLVVVIGFTIKHRPCAGDLPHGAVTSSVNIF